MEQPVSKYSSERAPGKEHIPLYPKGFVAIRVIQLILSIVCLGLSAFGIAYLVFAGDALLLFTVWDTSNSANYREREPGLTMSLVYCDPHNQHLLPSS